MNKYGFTEQEWRELRSFFAKYPEIEKVTLFGSRAKNTFKPMSDVDIVLSGKAVNYSLIAKLQSDLEESQLPWFFDILDEKSITSNELKEHLKRYGKTIYEKNDGLPEGWIETTLGEVAETNRLSINKDYKHEEILYLDTGSITKGQIEALQRIKTVEAPSRAKRLVNDKDIIYSTVRPNQEHYGYIEKPADNLVVSTGFTVIENNKEVSNSKFLYLFLTQKKVINALQQIAEHSTSAYPSVKPSDIKRLPLLLPPLPEQKAIAGVLSAFDDKIELLREQNRTLETLTQTIFKEWFANFNFPDIDGKPYKDNGGEVVDSELGKIPKGWRVGRLGEVASIIAGGDKPKNVTSQKTGRNIIPIYSNGIKNDGLYGYTDTARIFEESISVSARGTIGFVCLRMEPYVPIVRLLSVIPNKKYLSSKYLFFWLKNFNINGFGTTQQQLTVPVFKKSEIIIAAPEVINKFTEIIDSIYYKIKNNTTQIQTLSKTRDTLLPKLMNGEIRVNGQYKMPNKNHGNNDDNIFPLGQP